MTILDDSLKSRTCFLDALSKADRKCEPYVHWLLKDALPARMVTALADIDVDGKTPAKYDGTRELNNASRYYVNPEGRALHEVAEEVATIFDAQEVRDALAETTGADLEGASLRIELCHDRDGFWLEPHKDIGVKRFTMLIYLSDVIGQENCGTDIYAEDESGEPFWVGRAPFAPGLGLIFIPGEDTWHGYHPRPIAGVRKSIIVNYVGPEWRAKHELANPNT